AGVDKKLGRGVIQAHEALSRLPEKESALTKTPKDSASFPFLKVITGLGIAATDPRQQMLELEALQLIQQSRELEGLIPDPEVAPETISEDDRRKIVDALASAP